MIQNCKFYKWAFMLLACQGLYLGPIQAQEIQTYAQLSRKNTAFKTTTAQNDLSTENDKESKQTLRAVMIELNKEKGIYFLLSDQSIGNKPVNSIQNAKREVEKILIQVLKNSGLQYRKVNEKTFVIQQSKDGDKITGEIHPALFLETDESGEQNAIGLLSPPMAQSVLKGKVSDAQNVPLQGVTIKISGAGSVVTDANGEYAAKLSNGKYNVTFSYVGYVILHKQVTIQGADVTLNVTLEASANQLSDVVVSVGSRSGRRTITDSPIPIDIVGAADIQSTGQVSFDKALQYRVPSFNTVNTPVNDATSLLDPYEIRNMGPSRTLILINGKRKNSSSLTYIQTSPGQGESGADISAIPTDAIKRVEILRDGASAQYGSDAIAGVMNIILKDRYEYGTVTLNTGITGKGDGQLFGVTINNGANFGQKGFFNYTVDLSHIAGANRAGNIDPIADFNTLGGGINPATGNPYTQADASAYIAQFPDGNNKNEAPQTAAAKFLVNSAIPITENSEVYFNAAYVYKKVNSFANYRVPVLEARPLQSSSCCRFSIHWFSALI